MSRPMSVRPRFLSLAIAVLATTLLVTACSDADDTTSTATGGSSVAHRFGVTEVPDDPQRIVAVGATDADTLVALGIEPVAAYENTGFGTGPFFPWIDGAPQLAATEPLEVGADGSVNIEQVAALEPDLIFAVNLYTDAEQQYELLSEIAPTVAASADPTGMSWAEHTMEIAAALGREEDGRRLIDEVETSIADTAADNPEFAGATLSFGGIFDAAAATMVFGEEDYARIFLGELGFTTPPAQLEELPALAPEGQTQADVGLERLDLLDADVLVLGSFDSSVADEFTAREVFQQLPVVVAGRYVEAQPGTIAALRLPSVRSIPFVLDELVPELRSVLT